MRARSSKILKMIQAAYQLASSCTRFWSSGFTPEPPTGFSATIGSHVEGVGSRLGSVMMYKGNQSRMFSKLQQTGLFQEHIRDPLPSLPFSLHDLWVFWLERIETTRREKERNRNKRRYFLFLNKIYRKPVYGLIPVNQGMNHSPPYLLGSTQLESNKHRGTRDEAERKKEYDPA